METVSALRLEQAISRYKDYYCECIIAGCDTYNHHRQDPLEDNVTFGEWLDISKDEAGFVSDLFKREELEEQLSITYDDLTEEEKRDWDKLVEMYKNERFIDDLAWKMHDSGLSVNQVPLSYTDALDAIYREELEDEDEEEEE